MRNFIISLVCFIAVISVWAGFHVYSDKKTSEFQTQLNTTISQYIEQSDWPGAKDSFNDFSAEWTQYKYVASFFLDSKPINDIDSTLERARYYILAEDISNSSGELAYLKDMITFLHSNESVTNGNIF